MLRSARSTWLVLATAAILSLALGGCGRGEDSATAPGTGKPT